MWGHISDAGSLDAGSVLVVLEPGGSIDVAWDPDKLPMPSLQQPETAGYVWGQSELNQASQLIASRLRASWLQHRLDTAARREAAIYNNTVVVPRKRIFLGITACDLLYFIAMIIYLGATRDLNSALTSNIFSSRGNSFVVSVWLDRGSEEIGRLKQTLVYKIYTSLSRCL